MGKVKRKKKLKVVIKARKKVQVGAATFYEVWKTHWAQFKPNQKYKTVDVISCKKTSSITSLFINEDGRPVVHADITLAQLEAFFKSLKRDLPNLRKINKKLKGNLVGIRHLAPDLSLAVYKREKK